MKNMLLRLNYYYIVLSVAFTVLSSNSSDSSHLPQHRSSVNEDAAVNHTSLNRLLCVVFFKAARAEIENLRANVNSKSGSVCDWAVLAYGGSSIFFESVTALNSSISGRLVYIFFGGNTEESVPHDRPLTAIMKPVLYVRLLPLLAHYSRVWLLDDDVSILHFDAQLFLKTLSCLAPDGKGPLISQVNE